MKKYLLLFILVITYVSSQSQNSITIGILTDKFSEESQPLLEQLKSEIIAVVGQETNTIMFNGTSV